MKIQGKIEIIIEKKKRKIKKKEHDNGVPIIWHYVNSMSYGKIYRRCTFGSSEQRTVIIKQQQKTFTTIRCQENKIYK